MADRLPAFDIIGEIAIFESPENASEEQLIRIAKDIKANHKRIKTVMVKGGERAGRFRLRRVNVVLGKDTETVHREHGSLYKMDVRKVYFSPREATERQRIASMVRQGEKVLVMFGGVGPFAIAVAKTGKPQRVYCIEINGSAYRYMKENIRVNKVGDRVVPVLGDVREKVGDLKGKCDRVVMPLPKEGYKYLPDAFSCIGKSGFIHFYYFEHEKDLFRESSGIVRDYAKAARRKVRIMNRRKVLPYGPRVWKVCLDIKVL